jgi:uncharacterized membrane protein YbhN (UPF0104 family)
MLRCGTRRVPPLLPEWTGRLPAPPAKAGALKKLHKYLPYLAVAALLVACWLVWLSVRQYSLADITQAIRDIPHPRLVGAALFCAASYLTLTTFDWLATRYAGVRLPYRRVALASFVSLSLGHSIGLAPLGSGAIRARYYAGWGLDAQAIAKIILFCTVTVTLGQIGFAGLALVLEPGPAAGWLHLDDALVRAIGGACLLVNVVYVVLAARMRRPLEVRSWSFRLPRWRLALLQVLLGTLNFGLLAGAIYELLAHASTTTFLVVTTVFVLANCAALISHVPGGLGVIEWVILSLFPEANAFAAVLVYRTLYYLVPLGIGGATFGATAFRRRRDERRLARGALIA